MTITLNDLSFLARSLIKADSEVEEAEQILKQKKEAARIIREETLPSAMQELEFEKIKLDSGEEITVKQEVFLSIPVARKPEAFKWLDDHGFGGMIKHEVTASFGRGEEEAASEAINRLQAMGIEPDVKQDVNAQTLKAWAREQLSEANQFPMDLFGARPVWQAKVKVKKS